MSGSKLLVTKKDVEKLKKSEYLIEDKEEYEKNQWLIYKAHGDDKILPKTFSVKVYTGKKGYSIVTNDEYTYKQILEGTLQTTKKPRPYTLEIDDSAWGCPLSGTFVACCLEPTGIIKYDEVPVRFYQSPLFETKKYLDEHARRGIDIISKLLKEQNISKNDVDVTICTGYLNTKLKDKLRQLGFEVKVSEIKGKLQDELEQITKNMINQRYHFNLYYDPKEIDPVTGYQKIINWIKEDPKNRVKYAKTGWSSFKEDPEFKDFICEIEKESLKTETSVVIEAIKETEEDKEKIGKEEIKEENRKI